MASVREHRPVRRKFYDALFVAMGGKPGVEDAKAG